ncbi:lipid A export ATP-binding/permease protein MsbA [Lachnospiraceae bacterium]|nr:lipid A export ATP-binding/permease protein MsbA [Lachnospiraceae bacterium]
MFGVVVHKTQELLDDQFMQDKKREYAALDSNQQVIIKNMSYYYGRVKCLSDVNINIEKGKKYAVIGASGSGKSTLLKIIANLLNDYHGEVLFIRK